MKSRRAGRDRGARHASGNLSAHGDLVVEPPRDENHRDVRSFLEPRRLRQVAGWLVLGVAAMVAEIALLGLLYQGLGIPLWLASALAAETLILVRFVVADRWVFGYAHPAWSRCGRYHGAAAGAFVVSWVVLNGSAAALDASGVIRQLQVGLLDESSVRYVVPALLGTGAAFVWSFLTNFLWVWRPAPLLVEELANPAASVGR